MWQIYLDNLSYILRRLKAFQFSLNKIKFIRTASLKTDFEILDILQQLIL